MISNHNSENHLHMFDKDTIAEAVFDMKTCNSSGVDRSSSEYFKHDTV